MKEISIKCALRKSVSVLLGVCILLSGCSAADRTAESSAEMTTTAQAAESPTESAPTTAAAESAAVTAEASSEAASTEGTDPDLISNSADLPFPLGDKIQSDTFTGDAYLSVLIPHDTVYNVPQTNSITFAPGARSGWHVHGGMVILVTGGKGYYQEEGKAAQILRKGDIVNIPAGTRHWHGAAKDSWFSQIVMYDSEYVSDSTAVDVPVSEEEYSHLQEMEYAERNPEERKKNTLMFERGTVLSSENFSGKTYVSQLLSENNAAGAPPLYYVVFEAGDINSWHLHPGGQILIATDGIGYHQLSGEDAEILLPGQTAYCPPGDTHWHGASQNTEFAHIAIDTNPGQGEVQWFDRISAEEYDALSQP